MPQKRYRVYFKSDAPEIYKRKRGDKGSYNVYYADSPEEARRMAIEEMRGSGAKVGKAEEA